MKTVLLVVGRTVEPHFITAINDYVQRTRRYLSFELEVIPELKVCDKDYVVPKRRYSGFFQTDLDILLRELGVKTVVMTGLHTHMCVRHTSADAFCLGYDVVVAREATDSFTEEDYKAGLAYLKTCYGADAYSNEELIAAF